MRLTFFVPSTRKDDKGRPKAHPGMNELISDARTNRFKSADEKKKDTKRVMDICSDAMSEQGWTMPPTGTKVEVTFLWSEVNANRDQDNITAFQKPLLDGIKEAGAIADDSQKCIRGCSKNFIRYDRYNPGVLVTLETTEGWEEE